MEIISHLNNCQLRDERDFIFNQLEHRIGGFGLPSRLSLFQLITLPWSDLESNAITLQVTPSSPPCLQEIKYLTFALSDS